jgi:hypothetical protein
MLQWGQSFFVRFSFYTLLLFTLFALVMGGVFFLPRLLFLLQLPMRMVFIHSIIASIIAL